MPVTILVGAQWGDEGKGKITDLLAAEFAVVARYGGGDNAGHTVVVNGEKFALHLIPSGVLNEGTECLLGTGMVINPARLVQELDGLGARGIDVSHVHVSDGAHLIMPWHLALDGALEQARSGGELGTTRRGIGPAYADKASRVGIRVAALKDDDTLVAAIRAQSQAKNRILRMYGHSGFETAQIIEEYVGYARRLRPAIVDGVQWLHQRLAAGRRILCEGAQAALLDLDHGTYPYVTSSSPIAGGALTGLGFGPQHVERVIGVVKAYGTRVGAGPFPTEVKGEVGDRLVEVGAEYGTTTGRRRRVGWLDMIALRYAIQVSGITELALTKLDVLTGLAEIPVCIGYRLRGKPFDHFPADAQILAECEPEYRVFAGWTEAISAARSRQALPREAQRYVQWIEDACEVPVRIISIGPGREQTILER